MNIKVNNNDMQSSASTVAELIAELRLPSQGVAVAMDDCLIPRPQWGEQTLTEGASITIIKAACGG